MASSNPVSPKTIAAGIGAAVLPIVIAAVVSIVDALSNSDIFSSLSPSWQFAISTALGVLGAVLAAYRARDGLRLPTLDQAEVDKLPDAVEVE